MISKTHFKSGPSVKYKVATRKGYEFKLSKAKISKAKQTTYENTFLESEPNVKRKLSVSMSRKSGAKFCKAAEKLSSFKSTLKSHLFKAAFE